MFFQLNCAVSSATWAIAGGGQRPVEGCRDSARESGVALIADGAVISGSKNERTRPTPKDKAVSSRGLSDWFECCAQVSEKLSHAFL